MSLQWIGGIFSMSLSLFVCFDSPAMAADEAAKAHAEISSWNRAGEEQAAALRVQANADKGLDVYEVCASCHLPEGWGSKDGEFPQLAGQHRQVLIKQLADIRALNRDNPTMYPFTLPEAIGDEHAIANVAAYIQKLPMNPEHGKGPASADLLKGEQLYNRHCVQCHGAQGQGDAQKFYPRIAGQHYAYMLRQFRWIKEGKRRNANPDMVAQIQNFSEDDMLNVIAYVASIPLPKADIAPSEDWKNPDFE